MPSKNACVLPPHLPNRLSIGMFIWNWITMAADGECYDDLERVVAGLPQRGFNAVRVEAGLNWCFRTDGTPRGEMAFCPAVAGYQDNLTSFDARGGGRHDVLARVVRLMEAARRNGVYVILTSWEYQDSTWFVADPAVRAEVMAVSAEARFMHMARQQDRLLTVLKDKGLDRHVAFVEIHNEPDCSLFPQGAPGRSLHEEAVAFLRDRHGDILVAGDYATHNLDIVPDNIQVYDQHLYLAVGLYFAGLYAQTVHHKDFDPAHPRQIELLDRLLKDPFVPWEQFQVPARNVREFWRGIHWLYHNLDNARFDEWIAGEYARQRGAIEAAARTTMAADSAEAARRGIPAVCDEGGFFYPPLNSRFELTPPGLALFELMTDLAIEHGYWGFMPSTYCGAEHPLWHNIPWLRTTNARFLAGG